MGVVQVANPTPEGIVSAALLALVALWPRYSYRISGTLITRAETPGYGVVFDVKRYGAREGASDVRWAVSWDEAVADAAYAATALILPYTGLSAKAPWTSWQGKMLPPMLFGHYQRAQKLSNGRRYDEALHFYYRALDLDPHNVSIRLQIAMLQERLGLFIDALDTYLNLHKLIQLRTWRPPPSEQRSKADGGQLGLAAKARFLWAARRPEIFVAHYRYVITLGCQDKLTEQWHSANQEPGKGKRRDAVLKDLRKRLRPLLLEEYSLAFQEKHGFDLDPRDILGPQSTIDEGITKPTESFFLCACCSEAQRLHDSLNWLTRIVDRPKISRAAVKLVMGPWLNTKRTKIKSTQDGKAADKGQGQPCKPATQISWFERHLSIAS